MIKTVAIKLKMNSKTISHYKKLGYDVECNQTYDIKVKDLTKGCKSLIIVICDICGKEKTVSYKEYCRNILKYNIFCCSNKCSVIKNKKTSLNKYGVDHYSKTEEFINRVKNTNYNKYNFEYYTQTEEYKNIIKNKNIDYSSRLIKQKKTFLEKYGNENYHKSQDFKNKKNLIISKYKDTVTKKLLNKYNNLISTNNHMYTFLCKEHHEFDISRDLLKNRIKLNTELCTICNPVGPSKSGYEIQLFNFISSNIRTEILKNNRTILNNQYELDIYIPELKLAFEFNGLYWHNEINKPNNYHKNKTDACDNYGIQLIHIYEDDWKYKKDIIESILLNKLNKTKNKIFARKCEIKELTDNRIVKSFLYSNHIQGFVGSRIKIGLFYNDRLVSLMTFGSLRKSMGQKSKENSYELLRFCNELNTTVIGGPSKLFKYFIKNYKPHEIITYADRSYSNGNLYYNLGFNFIKNTVPNYYYIIDNIRKNRFNYRKNILVKSGEISSKTERQIMIDKKIFRIYDSGNLKFIYINKKTS